MGRQIGLISGTIYNIKLLRKSLPCSGGNERHFTTGVTESLLPVDRDEAGARVESPTKVTHSKMNRNN